MKTIYKKNKETYKMYYIDHDLGYVYVTKAQAKILDKKLNRKFCKCSWCRINTRRELL